jgi:thiamine-phosphate pyrophosphorylase
VLTDEHLALGRPLVEIVEEAIQGGATIIQYRAKDKAGGQMIKEALALLKVTHRHQVPLIINDRIDVALAVDADGVHLGQEDIPCTLARKLMGPDKIIGISASSPATARQAEQNGANYLGVGAAFPTGTKADAGAAIGLEGLRTIRRIVKIPVVAIGGINIDNAAATAATGVAGLAVVSAVVAAPDPKQAAATLKQAFLQGQSQLIS